ncbi:hypothetical protein GE300_10560 [Rhodobacteraceae bacterium 2CG4]|uniref:Uncharacterized protein n=1 Tax=Halovulum marinum TaxID=2662447 RepID=A0A6L5Z1V7_9RHOB|nr:hypothetical protein [Halovulum marinum]MSU90050.1 hypothetical protein [Halovulum marinum]
MPETQVSSPDIAVAVLFLSLLVASLVGGPVRTLVLVFLGWRLTRLLALPALGLGLYALFR